MGKVNGDSGNDRLQFLEGTGRGGDDRLQFLEDQCKLQVRELICVELQIELIFNELLF